MTVSYPFTKPVDHEDKSFKIIDTERFVEIQATAKFYHKGYEISATSGDWKPEIRVYGSTNESLFVTYDMTGAGLKAAIDFIDNNLAI